jgi:hypothetical protein
VEVFVLCEEHWQEARASGAVMFSLRSGLKAKWINSDLPDNTAGWRSEWFYIVDQFPGLPRRTGHKPVKISE